MDGSTLRPIELLFHALRTAPQTLSVSPLLASAIEVRRRSRKRGPDLRIAITDQMAKEIRPGSDDDKRPVYLLVGIPRELAAEVAAAAKDADKRAKSRIIRPNAGGLAVPR